MLHVKMHAGIEHPCLEWNIHSVEFFDKFGPDPCGPKAPFHPPVSVDPGLLENKYFLQRGYVALHAGLPGG